jgi:hypothetical protein
LKSDIEIRRDDYLSGGLVYYKQYCTVVNNKRIGNRHAYLYDNNGGLLKLDSYKDDMCTGKTYKFHETEHFCENLMVIEYGSSPQMYVKVLQK